MSASDAQPPAAEPPAAEPPAATLDVQVDDKGPCSRTVHIRVPASRVDKEIEETFRNVERAVAFPGFRPGKAPRRLVEARLGDKVLAEVKERLVQAALDEAIDAKKLQPVGPGRLDGEKVNLARGSDLVFDVDLDVRPEFALPKLEELRVVKPRIEVTEADVDAEIERLREERATTADAGDEPLAEHGIATLHVEIRVGEETVLSADDVEWQHPSSILGGMLVEGLPETMLGKKKGEGATFHEKLPQDYRDEKWRGADAEIVLRIDGVQRVDFPALDEAFAKEMDYDTVDEMRAELRKELDRSRAARAEKALDDAIVDALLQAVPFDVPPSLLASEAQRVLGRYEVELRRQGIPEEQMGPQLAEARARAEERVRHDLRASFLLDRVASDRKVLATENEVRQEIAAMAARYNRTVPEMEDYMERNRLVGSVRAEIRERKTVRALREIVKIDEPAAPETKE